MLRAADSSSMPRNKTPFNEVSTAAIFSFEIGGSTFFVLFQTCLEIASNEISDKFGFTKFHSQQGSLYLRRTCRNFRIFLPNFTLSPKLWNSPKFILAYPGYQSLKKDKRREKNGLIFLSSFIFLRLWYPG